MLCIYNSGKNFFELNFKLKRAKTVILKTLEYNKSYIPVRIIVPSIKLGDYGGNLPILYLDILIIHIPS